MTRLEEHAPAKLNLTLHVLGRRPDGYHELDSLVVFASCGDRLSLTPGPDLSVTTTGPFATAITDGNLVTKAARLATQAAPGLTLGAFTLEKHLPVAAGLGGGSSDAAATLRLIRRANPHLASSVDWPAIATRCGADVPVCLLGMAARMQGLGERVTSVGPLPDLGCILVNPRVPLATADVFKALAAPPLHDLAGETDWPRDLSTPHAVIEYVRSGRNDLEVPARRLCPAIAPVLERLRSAPGVIAARMSGSGPTCFGLTATVNAAGQVARSLSGSEPGWWVAAAALR